MAVAEDYSATNLKMLGPLKSAGEKGLGADNDHDEKTKEYTWKTHKRRNFCEREEIISTYLHRFMTSNMPVAERCQHPGPDPF